MNTESKSHQRGKNFDAQDLTGHDFAGDDLRGASFIGANLSLANFQNANLRGANLEGANLTGANLEGADLIGIKKDEATIWPERFVPATVESPKEKLTFEQKVLASYFSEGRLTHIPMRRRNHLAVILDHIVAASFAEGAFYPEKEVNAALSVFHPDFATMRRLLVDLHYMTRSGGIYRRLVRIDKLKLELAQLTRS